MRAIQSGNSSDFYMKSTYQPLPAHDEPMGIVIQRGPREPDPVDHPRVRAYVWAPAPEDFDALAA